MNPHRLYRSRTEKQLAGVAGGMAEYLDLDPTVVRVAWILSAFVGGLTIVLYVILAFVMPLEPLGAVDPASPADPESDAVGGEEPGPSPVQPRRKRRGAGAGLYLGVLLVVFGTIALADAAIPGWVDGGRLGPAMLLALGATVVVSSLRRTADEQ